jgi:hypothetical protein
VLVCFVIFCGIMRLLQLLPNCSELSIDCANLNRKFQGFENYG